MGGDDRQAGPVSPWPDPLALAEHARRQFGLAPIERVSLIPGGWSARSYRLHDATGGAYVVKAYDQSPDARTWLAAMVERLPILHDLHHSGRFPWLPAPVRAIDGAFTVPFDRCDLLLSTFVPGRHPPEDCAQWPEALVRQFAERVAALHSLGETGLFGLLPREEFRLVFRSSLEEGMERLEAAANWERPGVLALRELLLPRRHELLHLIDRTEELAVQARGRTQSLVPCHADLHRLNLIVGEDGALYLLDWEGLRLAPAEQDLFFWADEPIGASVLRRYLTARPDADLDADTFAYYYHYRNLEDLEAWVSRILDLDRGLEVHRRDVQAISEYCMRWWGELEATSSLVARKLIEIARAAG